MPFFDKIPLAPKDPIYGLVADFHADPRPEKINLIMGIYKNPDLTTPVLNTVKKAEAYLLNNEKNKEYFPIEGDKHYLHEVATLTFGATLWNEISERTASIQAIGGTGALWLGAQFLKNMQVSDAVYYPNPTWANHRQILNHMGMRATSYPYYDTTKHVVSFDALCAFLETLEPRDTILLHASCHNPTGADLTLDQWRIISTLCLKKQLIPFFDIAYQGFGDGIEEDTASIRLFIEMGNEILVANTFSKNFGLYGERVGALFVVTQSAKNAKDILSQLCILTRTHSSSPPIHGAKIVTHILREPDLRKEWETEVSLMRQRVDKMRTALTESLLSHAKKRDYSFLKNRKGLFCFCGLEPSQIDRLIPEYAIYTTRDGRINIAGLNPHNWHFIASAISKVGEE